KEPDLLVSIFTKTAQNVNVHENYYGWRFGHFYDPWYWGWPYGGAYNRNSVSSNVEGTLYIDLIDGKENTLVWQGLGTADLKSQKGVDERTERINEIVKEILDHFPPGHHKKKK